VDRRRFLVTALAGVLVSDRVGEAQLTRMPHLVYVVPGPPACGMTPVGEAFQQALKEFGFVPGESIRWDRHCFRQRTEYPF
jgi:hypothetical protein